MSVWTIPYDEEGGKIVRKLWAYFLEENPELEAKDLNLLFEIFENVGLIDWKYL